MRSLRPSWLVSVAAFLLLVSAAGGQEAARAPWSERAVELFATLPIQDGGRVKPLDTYAQFQLLKMNGKRRFTAPSGEKLTPIPWLLDVFFHPEFARTYRTFLVRDSALLEAIGVRVADRKKSDRYSYDELAPGRERLFAEAGRIRSIEQKQWTGKDSQLFALATSMRDFESLASALQFTRATLPTSASRLLSESFGTEDARLQTFLERWGPMQADFEARLAALDETQRAAELEAFARVGADFERVSTLSSAVAVFPPEQSADEQWLRAGDALGYAVAGDAESAALLAGWEALERAKGEPAAFESAMAQLHGRVTALAERRGEYSKIPLEVRFYKGDYFTRALVAYLAAFLCVCASWLATRSRWLVRGAWGLTALGTLLVVVGVTLRCVIRARPPVSTLYETILFITGSIAIVLLVIEWIQRQRIALALAPVLGAAGMFLAMKYELKEAAGAGDTMPSLVAVLDTNFWLATHVTTVTLGYAAGLLAAALGNVWLIGKMVGLRRGDKDFYRALSRMTYGVVCFGLLFSVVGTILGGVWANYSWGRFWGWDPKENGALLICIGGIFILHARMGGYAREHGIAALAALNGLAVAFSWWHVNNLDVGLHSYGKAEGVLLALYTYYGIGLLVVFGSLLWRLGTRQAPAPAVQLHGARVPLGERESAPAALPPQPS